MPFKSIARWHQNPKFRFRGTTNCSITITHTIQIETNYNTDEQRPFLISRLTFAPPAAAASQTDRGSQHIVMHSVRMSVNQNKAGTETKL